MSLIRRALAPAAIAVAGALSVGAGSAAAEADPSAVYVLSNQTSGNAVLVFDRAADGTLSAAGSVSTGGLGTGAGLGSQGAVVIEGAGRYLYAVNAGSNSVSSFRIEPDGLSLVDVEPSGGATPISVTVHGDLVYVLNAGAAGGISGFTVDHGDLTPLAGSGQPLSASGVAPGEVAFTPDGRALVVTEKGSGRIDVFPVAADGTAGTATVAASSGAVPFGFAFDNKSHLIVSEAAASTVSSYDLVDGGLDVISASVPTTEVAACWIATTGNGRFAYAGNAGTASVTGYAVAPDGSLTILDADGKTASAAAGVTDLATSVDSQYLYGRIGNRTVDAWAINADGSLTDLGSIGGLPAGTAGIAAR